MFNISDYLKKFSRLGEDSTQTKEAVSKALSTVCGIREAVFEIRKGVVYLDASSIVKAVIFTKKRKLLEEIQKTVSKGKVSDIR